MKKLTLLIMPLLVLFILIGCNKSVSYDIDIKEQSLEGNTYTFVMEFSPKIDKDEHLSIAYSTASEIYSELKDDIGSKTRFLNIDFLYKENVVITLKYQINVNELKPGLNLLETIIH